jgi:hypothetical protein
MNYYFVKSTNAKYIYIYNHVPMFFASHLLHSKASLCKNKKKHYFVMWMSKVSQDRYRIDLCGGGGVSIVREERNVGRKAWGICVIVKNQ